MFKAGRTSGRGTGSLRFIRNITCKCPYKIEFRLSKVSKRNHAHDRVRDLGDDRDNCAWHDWESVANCVGDFSIDRGFSRRFMHKASVQRLVSIIVMVASECIDATKDSESDAIGKLCVSGEDSD